jgi:hypothetical protein
MMPIATHAMQTQIEIIVIVSSVASYFVLLNFNLTGGSHFFTFSPSAIVYV